MVKTTNYKDDKDRVLIKTDGSYTYFAVDIAYHFNKVTRKYNHLINILGADHHGYVNRLKAAVSALTDDSVELTVLIGQLVTLFENGEPLKMSKRTGTFVTLDEVIDEIGPDATRYFLIEKSPDSHVDFDMDLAKKKTSENPVFYIQYAHARICRIYEKSNLSREQEIQTITLDPKERALLIKSMHFHDVVYDAASNLSPHKVALYLHDLAKTFHSFYENCPIIGDKNEAQRLNSISFIKQTIQNGLSILGISAPNKM